MRNIFALLLPLLALVGCTLSIEDELPQPEEMGFDEPVTIENELGTVTYQFQDDVLYVTERVQEHITVINDSTFFYDGSTPKEWRPYVGCKLAASVSHLLYNGLNNRVIRVTPQDGGYLVETERTTIEDVYKELSYNLDVENNIPYVTDDTSPETLEALGIEKINDSTYYSWALYDEMRDKALGIKHKDKTRTSESVDTYKEGTNKLLDITIDTRSGLISGIKESYRAWDEVALYMKEKAASLTKKAKEKGIAGGLFSGEFYAALHVSRVSHTRTHVMRDEKLQKEENWTESYDVYTFGSEAGYAIEQDIASSTTAEKVGKQATFIKNANAHKAFRPFTEGQNLLGSYFDKNAPKIKMPSFNIKFGAFMLGPVPFNLCFKGGVDVELSLQGCFAASMSATTETWRKGYKIANGHETQVNELVKKGTVVTNEAVVDGNLAIGVSGRVAIGLEIAGSAGFDIGLNAECYLKAEGKIGYMPSVNADTYITASGNVHFYAEAYGDVQVYLAPLGMSLWNKQLCKFLNVSLFDFTSSFSPKVAYVGGNANQTQQGDHLVNAYFALNQLGFTKSLLTTKKASPQMRLYFGPYKEDGEYINMLLVDKDNNLITVEEADERTNYYFYWIGNIPDDVSYCTLVPCLGSTKPDLDKESVICTDYQQVLEVGKPKIDIISKLTHQSYGGEAITAYNVVKGSAESYVDVNAESSGGGVSIDVNKLRQYDLMAGFSVKNGSYIDSWRIKVEIYDQYKKKLATVPVKMSAKNNKTGVYTLVFTFFSNWAKDGLSSGNPPPMYYKVRPYWTPAAEAQNADGSSSAKEVRGNSSDFIPIEYEAEYDTPLGFEKEYGTIVNSSM